MPLIVIPVRRLLALGLPVLLCASVATAQPPDVSALSLEDLLGVHVVSTASKFSQEVREAPASITVITAEEIRRYGHRTLADSLRSVRGFYTTYDRNYSYAGMRGFARPGDYNTRMLLLLDGHRLNDGIYDMAPIGTDFPVDISLIDRIEVIRGPGSSLYGTSAFFAVVNVITHKGATRKGLQVEAQAGSLDTRGLTASFGRIFDNGSELLAGGSSYGSSGQERLWYPEFGGGASGDVAVDLDHDESSKAFAAFSSGRLSLRANAAHRRKQIPTASYGSAFGDDRESTNDDRAFVDAVYDGPVGRGWSGSARLAYDYYGYQGDYPVDYGDDGVLLSQDSSSVHTMTGEVTARRRVAAAHLLTAGIEVRRQMRNRQRASDYTGVVLDVAAPGTNIGLYVQDEVRIFSWLLGNVGARLDRFPAFGTHLTPRAALVVLPRPQTAVKLLYGKAFRAPNAYELHYFNAALVGPSAPLRPEQIESGEIVWEEALSRHVRTTVTAFAYDAKQLIEQQRLDTSGFNELYFANVGHFFGLGAEAEVEVKLSNGVSTRVSQTFARVRDHETRAAVSNSPSRVSKLGLQVPVSRLFLSLEGQYVGERLTLGGERLPGFFVPNIVLTSPVEWRVGLTIGMYNAFNRAYSDPGAEEHLQQSIRQDGRTVLARIRVGL